MHTDFWHEKWSRMEIGFHEGEVNEHLHSHLDRLRLPAGKHILVPLCGKSRDIAWLMEKQFQVTGIELSRVAVEQLFDELNVKPDVKTEGELTRFCAPGITVFNGDIFSVEQSMLGNVDAIYDRAALVALPDDMRLKYANKLMELTLTAPQLLITFEYDQSVQAGPPFAVTESMLAQYYASFYQLSLLERVELPGGLKGTCPATSVVWLLEKNRG